VVTELQLFPLLAACLKSSRPFLAKRRRNIGDRSEEEALAMNAKDVEQYEQRA
jgi:hypothetical protein